MTSNECRMPNLSPVPQATIIFIPTQTVQAFVPQNVVQAISFMVEVVQVQSANGVCDTLQRVQWSVARDSPG